MSRAVRLVGHGVAIAPPDVCRRDFLPAAPGPGLASSRLSVARPCWHLNRHSPRIFALPSIFCDWVALGWTCVAASGPDSDLMQQLRDYWAALPEDPGPGAMREMLYHPGMLRKLRKGFDVLFPPASHLRERSPTRSITALRLKHIYKMLTGVSGDLFRGPGLNRMPSISLKRDVYRRRAERRRG